MNKDLFFIPIFAKAFQQPDRVGALRNALAEIEQLGQTEEYRIGLEQFDRFMAEAYSQQVPHVRLEKDGVTIAELVPSLATEEIRVPGILPGLYSVYLSTGRLLWAGSLDEEDLLWAQAFPSASLRLAADSAESRAACTRELKLLQDEIVVRVYPGLENGMIGIRIDRWKNT